VIFVRIKKFFRTLGANHVAFHLCHFLSASNDGARITRQPDNQRSDIRESNVFT